MTRQPLAQSVTAKIEEEGKSGREAWKSGDLAKAERHFLSAWDALPEPKLEFDYAQLLSSGIAEFYRDTHQFEKAWHWIRIMRTAYGPEPNPYPEFLAGTIAFESGELDDAYGLFRPLYERYGSRPFEGRDKKYLDLVRRRIGEQT